MEKGCREITAKMSVEGLNLAHLTEAERDAIISVIQRDENLTHKDEARIKKLKAEIKMLRLKGVIRAGIDPDRTCSRCRAALGFLFNRGELCPQCHSKVCKECKEVKINGEWVCVLCHKQMQLKAMSGSWFYQKFRKSKRHRKTNKVITGGEIVRHSMKRPLGNEAGTRGAALEVKRALGQNGSSLPPMFSASATDTDSSECPEGVREKRRAKNTPANLAYPSEEDQQVLADLVRARSPHRRPNDTNVRRVQTKHLDSDSSSSDEEYDRMVQYTRTMPQMATSPQSQSMSSDRATSPVDQHSDLDLHSAQSSATESSRLQDSPRHPDPKYSDNLPLENNNRHLLSDVTNKYASGNVNTTSHRHPGAPATKRDLEWHGTGLYNSSVEEDIPDGKAAVEEEVIVPTLLSKTNSKPDYSVLTSDINGNRNTSQEQIEKNSPDSDSGEDYEVEQLTNVKFRRVSVKKSPQSPSNPRPSPPVIIVTEDETDSMQLSPMSDRSSGSLSGSREHIPLDNVSRQKQRDIREHVTFAPDTKPEVDQHQEMATHQSSAAKEEMSQSPTDQLQGSSVPYSRLRGTVAASTISEEDLEDEEKEENIDELVAQHRSSVSAASPSDSSRSNISNLASPFSKSLESLTSYYSDAGEGHYGRIPVSGDIQLGLEYIYKTGVFQVHVKSCRNLAPVDVKRKRSDPYVKTYLLPDKTKNGKRKTRVKKHTLNPTFDETLKYFMSKGELETRTLWVTVWHSDTFGRNDFLGEVTIPLDYYKFGEPSPKWYPLKERNPVPLSLLTYKGDLILSLKYVTADKTSSKKGGKGELHVLIKEARNLTAVSANGSSDPFCKGYLLPEKGKASKQKTPVIKRECNPKWNHTFIFKDVSQLELRDRCLELTVWDHDIFTSNDFLGGVRLNLGSGKCNGKEQEWMDARGEEVSIWQSMLDRPNCWIEGSLLLRANMDMRK